MYYNYRDWLIVKLPFMLYIYVKKKMKFYLQMDKNYEQRTIWNKTEKYGYPVSNVIILFINYAAEY